MFSLRYFHKVLVDLIRGREREGRWMGEEMQEGIRGIWGSCWLLPDPSVHAATVPGVKKVNHMFFRILKV